MDLGECSIILLLSTVFSFSFISFSLSPKKKKIVHNQPTYLSLCYVKALERYTRCIQYTGM